MAMQRNQSVSGAVLSAARVLAGMTQAELARAAGLHAKSVAYWERKGASGKYGEVGARRMFNALRAKGVEILQREEEGAQRTLIATTGKLAT